MTKMTTVQPTNPRWNNEVDVKWNNQKIWRFQLTLLASQENERVRIVFHGTKDAIVSGCCFAGSDMLVAMIANQVSTESDAPCSVCASKGKSAL